jgi:CDP-diacylglycerol--serine O-phosphatidyltransferase
MVARSIPNLFTLGNLFLGILAILWTFQGRASEAVLLVFLAMLLDGLDGRVARALNAQSEFGKELDSLSDVVSFGVAPAFIMYYSAFAWVEPAALTWTVTAMFPICGALRLARYNVRDGIPGYFVGLPIPAAGGVLAALAIFAEDLHVSLLMLSMVALSLMMISTTKYPNFKKFGLPKPAVWAVPLVVAGAVVLAWLFPSGIPQVALAMLLVYALWGFKRSVKRFFRRVRRRSFRAKEAEREHHSA